MRQVPPHPCSVKISGSLVETNLCYDQITRTGQIKLIIFKLSRKAYHKVLARFDIIVMLLLLRSTGLGQRAASAKALRKLADLM